MAKRAYEEKNIRAIAEAIRMNTHDTATYTVAEMAGGIDYVYNHAHTNGEQFGYDLGYEEGYDEGYEAGIKSSDFDWEQAYDKGYGEGWTDGFSEGQESAGFDYDIAYNEGYQVGYGEGYGTGFNEGQADVGNAYGTGYNDGYDSGVIEGKQEQYDEFWDAFLSGSYFVGKFSGQGWTRNTFRPNKDITITGSANNCFFFNYCDVDLVEWCRELGITITFKPSFAASMFHGSRFTRLPELDMSIVTAFSSTFASCERLITIDKLKINNGTATFVLTFSSCYALKNITIEGIIGKDIDFKACTELSKASITSAMNARSTTATFTMTFSKAAVDKAFETAEGANDGSTSAEWIALDNERPNVTTALI